MLKTTRSKIKAGTIGCLILILLFVVVSFVVFTVYPAIRELSVKRSLVRYDNSRKVYEDRHHSDVDLETYEKRLYYWTEDPVAVVRAFYEPHTSEFIQSNDRTGAWWIVRQNPDSELPMARSYGSHSDFCAHYDGITPLPNSFDHYDCVTVTLVDMQQEDLRELGIIRSLVLRSGELPPELAALPNHGTLIVFGYYIQDWRRK